MNTKDYMRSNDAILLVQLRIKEDGVSWATAFKEYKQLTGRSTADSLHIGRFLAAYEKTIKE